MALTDKLKTIADNFRESRGLSQELTLVDMAELALVPIGGGQEMLFMTNGCKPYAKDLEIPSNVISIGNSLFSETDVETVIIGESVATIGATSFGKCAKLKSVTFKATPTTMSDNVFYQCYKLKTINVPWSEGTVANAPWGATYATINYDYVESEETV